MENTNIVKQAKSDIFKVLHPIITFYINKGAKPYALKKYYKNNKRFNDILDDIGNKGVNLVKDETEYKKLVREILNDILDDFIAKNKDDEYKNKKDSKMKHIKEFNSYNENLMDTVMYFCVGLAFYNFIKGLLFSKIAKRDAAYGNAVYAILDTLKKLNKIPVTEFADRFFIRLDIEGVEYDIRLLKNEKILDIDTKYKIPLSDEDFENFLSLIKK
jgi:hypothetical protein